MGLPLAREFGEKMTVHSNSIRKNYEKDPKHTVYYPPSNIMSQFNTRMNPVLKAWEESNPRWKALVKAYKEELAKLK